MIPTQEARMTEPVAIRFTDDGAIPNSALPMLVYRQAVPADPDAIEALFAANGWPPGSSTKPAKPSSPSAPKP